MSTWNFRGSLLASYVLGFFSHFGEKGLKGISNMWPKHAFRLKPEKKKIKMSFPGYSMRTEGAHLHHIKGQIVKPSYLCWISLLLILELTPADEKRRQGFKRLHMAEWNLFMFYFFLMDLTMEEAYIRGRKAKNE